MSNSARYAVSLALFALAACQDSPTDLQREGAAPAADLTSNIWQKRATMPSDRRLVMTATVDAPGGGSFLYAIGGKSMNDNNWCSGSLSKVQAYNGNTNTWSTKTPLPVPKHAGLTGVVNGRVYVVGGCGGGMSDQVFEYEVATNIWREKTSAPMSLPGPVGAVVAGKIYSTTNAWAIFAFMTLRSPPVGKSTPSSATTTPRPTGGCVALSRL